MPSKLAPTQKKRRVGDFESLQSSIMQSIVNTAAKVGPIPNPYLSPVIGIVSPMPPLNCAVDQRADDNLVLDGENLNFE